LPPPKADRAADIQRENAKKKRRELEQASMDAASDLLDTDSNATFAMVSGQTERHVCVLRTKRVVGQKEFLDLS
jgi:hypothetical protein